MKGGDLQNFLGQILPEMPFLLRKTGTRTA
jgi:hypothetical protein